MNKETKSTREYLDTSMVEMGKEILTQDNLATSLPIFCVQQKRRIWGIDTDLDDVKIIWTQSGEELEEELNNLLEETYLHGGQTTPKLRGFKYNLSDFDRFGYIDIWEFVQPFFTRKAAQAYIDSNKHRLKEPRIYVESGYRNYEWEVVRRYAADMINQ